jgi:hypothetical protein
LDVHGSVIDIDNARKSLIRSRLLQVIPEPEAAS